jgi:hypothetical protein
MNDAVERILNASQLMRPLGEERISDSRRKITKYIESLSTAGHRDAEQLTIYGLAYLKELHEGRDPRVYRLLGRTSLSGASRRGEVRRAFNVSEPVRRCL